MIALRLVNRLLAALLSLAVVAAAVLVVGEVARWVLDEPPWLVDWRGWGDDLLAVRVGDPEVVSVAAGAALVGLGLLVFELWPRGPKGLPTAALADGVTTRTTRRGVRSTAESAARGVPGVRETSVKVGRRTVSVTAGVRARGIRDQVQTGVRSAVEGALADLRLERTPKVSVSVEEHS